jgi:aldehyde:ferredoxin oxidoreductase
MAESFGWVGKVLRVDLGTGAINVEDTRSYTPFIGGRGFGLKVIAEEAPAARAFDAENRLIVAAGPLSGTPAPAAGRCTLVAVSPETYPREMVSHSSMGGYFGAELKYAGFDAVILQGRSPTPVYLWISDGQAELRSAEALWGLDTFETQKMIQRQTGPETEIACIGPAGENRVRTAVVIHGTGHACGHSGFGAVMGDKRLKAIACCGHGGVRVADPKAYAEAVGYARSLLGTGAHWPLPTKPFWVHHQDPHDLSRQAYRSGYTHQRQPWIVEEGYATVAKNTACYGCPVACYNYLYMPKAGASGGGDHNCTMGVGAARDETKWQAKQLCDRLGLNAYIPQIATKWLTWLREQGRMTEEEMGLPISASDSWPYAQELLRQIAYRQGIGAVLGEGMGRAAEQLGLLHELFTEEAFGYGGHGMLYHWGPRDWGMAMDLVWALENRDPNRHDRPGFSAPGYGWDPKGGILWEEVAPPIARALLGSEHAISPAGSRGPYHPAQARYAALIHKRSCLKESLPVCDWQFPIYISPLVERDPPYCGDLTVESRLYSAATGDELSMEELDEAGERVWTLQRLITMRQWGTRDLRTTHDVLPERFFLHAGSVEAPIQRDEWEQALDDYCQELGWEPATGAPTAESLKRLGLEGYAHLMPDGEQA